MNQTYDRWFEKYQCLWGNPFNTIHVSNKFSNHSFTCCSNLKAIKSTRRKNVHTVAR